ncbi:acyl-CoA dehydrogenase family protein [Amorphus orientalis]|uniref:Alkylation response protein AidB-like acyl-CoA dehydrogenase n=1 Tax=Amorphus orientalis TaxID=649198 RepID=A0AAE4AUF0_9HYPH|nr:acyl-CoA dehydrogenase family protein [Amorphus orientalis]MDQ0315794.1 alkylation response protein AidB-like acyl-CoA dehydrogenase [Amorphus orientalis]
MDVSFTAEQEAFRRDLRAWIAKTLPADWAGPRFTGPADEDENARFQTWWERTLYDAGYQGIHWPTAYGGQGLGIVEQLIAAEEFGRASAPEGINTIGKELVGPIVLAVGSEEQKRELIPRLLRLDDIWCQGFSEPEAGSDLAGLRTRAVREGDHWVVNGQKLWTSFARHANKCILLARTDPDAPKHKGLTLFVLDMRTPGITVRPVRQMTDRREFNEVFLDNVRIPAGMHLGGINEGWHAAVGVLGFERATARLYRQARFQAEFSELLRLLAARPEKAGDGWFRQTVGTLAAELRMLRLLNLKTASRIATGKGIGSEASIVKLFWSELHQRITTFALEVLGEDFAAGTPGVARFRYLYLQARAETLYAGTSEIQRSIIAERMLGLPR